MAPLATGRNHGETDQRPHVQRAGLPREPRSTFHPQGNGGRHRRAEGEAADRRGQLPHRDEPGPHAPPRAGRPGQGRRARGGRHPVRVRRASALRRAYRGKRGNALRPPAERAHRRPRRDTRAEHALRRPRDDSLVRQDNPGDDHGRRPPRPADDIPDRRARLVADPLLDANGEQRRSQGLRRHTGQARVRDLRHLRLV